QMSSASAALTPRSNAARSARAIAELAERGDGSEQLPGRLGVRDAERWGRARRAGERADLPGAVLPDQANGLGAPRLLRLNRRAATDNAHVPDGDGRRDGGVGLHPVADRRRAEDD